MEILLVLIIIIVPLIAQAEVNSAYSKYSKVENTMHMTGAEVAKKILDMNGLSNIQIYSIQGNLTDHYDPSKRIINLSKDIYSNTSIASAAVAAHEVGHAIQHKEKYSFLTFRTKLVPVVNFTSRFASVFIVIGFAASALNIVDIGIALMLFGLLFQLVTLPVEFDASRRAKKQLQACGLLAKSDTTGTDKVLNAAAMTYVSSFLATALQIFRLFLMSRDN